MTFLNIKELKIELIKQNLSIPKLADLLHKNKTTMYKRFNGKVSFSQKEISDISTILGLSQERIFEIFFTEEVA